MTNRKSVRYVIAVAAVVAPFSIAQADVQCVRQENLSQFKPTISIRNPSGSNFGSLISVASKDKDDYDQGYKNFGQWVSDQHHHRHHGHDGHDGDDDGGVGGGGNCHHPGSTGGGGQGGPPPVVSPPVAGPPVTQPPVAVSNPRPTTPPRHGGGTSPSAPAPTGGTGT